MQSVQVLNEGLQVITQCTQHLIIAMLQAVDQEILPKHLQDRIFGQT